MQTPSDIQIRLLDRFYSRLFSLRPSTIDSIKGNNCNNPVSEFRSDTVFLEMERYVDMYDDGWMRYLDKVCPDISLADRRLAMLLHLGFSSPSIAFLTGRPSTAAVHTAKTRLKQRFTAIGCDTTLIIDKTRDNEYT